MKDSSINSEKLKDPNYTIGKSGKKVFAKGNVIGRMPKKLTLTYLTKLIRKDERLHPDKPTLLKHYKDRLFKNDILLGKFMDKYIPTINEITGPGGGPITYEEHFPALPVKEAKKINEKNSSL